MKNIGFVAGAFDLLHAGHLHLLKECKKHCVKLVVGLHVDPSRERKDKNKPIESVLERQIRLRSCKYVYDVIVYETEEDLKHILHSNEIDIRFLGSDYIDRQKEITDPDIVPIKYVESLSIHTSEIRERIKNA